VEPRRAKWHKKTMQQLEEVADVLENKNHIKLEKANG